jgi:AcrR family transcriptional regulator
MPPKPRTKEEINAFREKILAHALDLIAKSGWEGFSMHKLADRLGIKAVTIYNYYENKDHLYIAIRTRGFQYLTKDIQKAQNTEKDPTLRLKAMAKAYMKFGLDKPNIYDLLFTWRVPMYRDYIDTPMEKAARFEYEVSMNMYGLFIRAAKELADTTTSLTDEELRRQVIYFGGVLHGYVSRINNNLLSYMHDDPVGLEDYIIETMFRHMQADLAEMKIMEDKN